eukprot:TRINITY_DN2984_c0_g1_i1.p1 TRINITY_DN2984_c0_g1~~TRINITY_DN2984_c0_g1_i1.p1  ORF type:complete len:208 (-),score=54.96 TRINITY_DN2984_c0_g1_i1:101-724(-)
MSDSVQDLLEDEAEEDSEIQPRERTSLGHTSSFDRLKPRTSASSSVRDEVSTSAAPKRKPTAQVDDPEQGVSEKKFKGSKQEYIKLRHLVPALNERDDISKVEIIEETIRYIDALHHQLAAKNSSISSLLEDDSQDSEEPPGPSTSSASAPLQHLSEGQRLNQRIRKPPSVPSSSSRSSPQDVKAAVENIQAMFAAFLDQKNSDGNS